MERTSLTITAEAQPVVFSLCYRYIRGGQDPCPSMKALRILIYFAQEVGEPLGFEFDQNPAMELEEWLNVDFAFEPGSSFYLALKTMNDDPDTRRRLHQVYQLIDGFESESGLSLLASVHWAATKKKLEREYVLIEPKRLGFNFTNNQVYSAYDRLDKCGLIGGF